LSADAVVVVAQYQARAGEEDTVATLLADYTTLVRAEPGCVAFSAHRALEDPGAFVLYECYRDQAAFDQHVMSAHFGTVARDRIRPLLEGRDVTLYGAALQS
jgi:autoinducer 2-degrading protein